MNGQTPSGMRLSLLDLAFNLLDGIRTPQDFTLIFHFAEPPLVESLRAGARSARNRYPTSGSHLDKKTWVCPKEQDDALDILSPVSNPEGRRAIERFLDEPFDLHHQTPVKQLLISNWSGAATLVTRFHHSAADGLSAAMWLGHQLQVTYGLEEPESERSSFSDLPLRRLMASVRRSRFAYVEASDPLWTSGADRSGARRWLTIGFPASELRKACRRAGDFTYSDLLATCALEVFTSWNRKHTNDDRQKIGLWVPMNIRQQSSCGFGNGTSRIRLYARYPAAASIIDKAREVRCQVSWSSKHGEWVVPEIPSFTRLPQWVIAPILRGFLNRPSVDMATGVFSHSERWAGAAGEAFEQVEKIQCVGLLHPRQSVAINGATHRGQTWLTFTYDPGLMSSDEAQELAEMYQQQVSLAQKELS